MAADRLRNRKFFSIEELNQAIRELRDRMTNADYRVFYIRYQTVEENSPAVSQLVGPIGLLDQLVPALKPLHPHVFDVFTPMDLRKAIARILREIAVME